MRPLVIPAALLLALPMTIPVASASDACEDARAALREDLAVSGHDPTPRTARLLKAAADACPAPSPDASDALPLYAGPVPPGPPGDYRLPGLPARHCGYLEPVETPWVEGDIKGVRQILWDTETTEERGPSKARYDPLLDVSTYEGYGPTYGLWVQTYAEAKVYYHGVPLPTVWSRVDVGCSYDGGALCWGRGVAAFQLKEEVVITVFGQFDICS